MNNIIATFFGYKKTLSAFPIFYNYREFAPFLLRESLAIIFILSGIGEFSKKGGWKFLNIFFGILKITTGIFLAIGMYSQIFALVSLALAMKEILISIKNRELEENLPYYFLLSIISISITLTGPGVFSIDLPL